MLDLERKITARERNSPQQKTPISDRDRNPLLKTPYTKKSPGHRRDAAQERQRKYRQLAAANSQSISRSSSQDSGLSE